MRILYLIKVSPRLGGGAERIVLEIGRRLVARGHEVAVIAARTELGLPASESLSGIQVHYLPTIPSFVLRLPRAGFFCSRIPFYFMSGGAIADVIKTFKPDVIRDDMSPFPNVVAPGIAKEHGIPIQVTIHFVPGSLREWLKLYGVLGPAGWWGEWLVRTRRLEYSKVVAKGTWTYRSLCDSLPADRVAYVPNGVDTSLFYPNHSTPRVDGPTRLLCACRFVPLKGHQYLLEAMAQLRSHYDVRLDLVGDGPVRTQMQTLAKRLRLEDVVSFKGYIASQRDMAEAYRAADLCVLPSLIEGQPVILLEAMASGLPVVATDIPAYEGVVSSADVRLARPMSASALAEAIGSLLDDRKGMREMGEKLKAKVEREFSWDSVVDKEVQIFESSVRGEAGR